MNADDLHARLVGELKTTEPIRAAFASHPRHGFVPDLIWPSSQGLPLHRTSAPARWLRLVYECGDVVTQANDGGSGVNNRPSSSSSDPQLMADMIAAAGVEPGMRVLEIGTGTGWNAAILASLVGPTGSVTTVEIDPSIAAHARKRLTGTKVRALTGISPPPEENYDAVIATCSAQRVPEEWTRGLVPTGTLTLPWAPHETTYLSPVAVLDAELNGRFVREASVMRDRTQRVPRKKFAGTAEEVEQIGALPFGSAELVEGGLITRLALTTPGLHIEKGLRPWSGGSEHVLALSDADSWMHLWPDGTTTGAGPRDLGQELLSGYTRLTDAGWPELPGFTIEVSPDRRTHTVRTGALGPWEHKV